MTRRVLEVDSLEDFDRRIVGVRRLNGWFVSSLDLRERTAALSRVDGYGAVFFGCTFTDETESALRRAGALLFPRLPDLPFDPYRSGLYDATQLYGDLAYPQSPDAAIYAWSAKARRHLDGELAAVLHDHAITDALNDATAELDPRNVVGVMGGHALQRNDASFREAAQLGLELTRGGRTVLTGGGPGAMEAANLGAYLSPWPDQLDAALAMLASAPSFRPDIEAWAQAGFAVRRQFSSTEAGHSISIPTWFYGHEPTNVFATEIAKYFANPLREDTLLHRCRGGIIYLPGQAGTVQEIFQAVTENFYATDPTRIAPMILVGTDYWNNTYPAWPLLEQLGEGREMADAIHCVQTVAEAAELVLR